MRGMASLKMLTARTSEGDRVIGLHSHPGRVALEMQIDLPSPRDQLTTVVLVHGRGAHGAIGFASRDRYDRNPNVSQFTP